MSKQTKHQIKTNTREMQLHISGTLAGTPYGVNIDVGKGKAEWDTTVPWHDVKDSLPSAEEAKRGCTGCGSVLTKLIKGGLGWAKELLNVDQVSPEVAAARKALCLLCPSKCHDFGICRDDWPNRTPAEQGCGCVLALKVTQRSEACPQNHWGRVDG